MQQWFNGLQRKEQIILVIGSVCVLLYIIFMVMWKPMSSSIDVLKVQNASAQKSLVVVKQLAAEYKSLQLAGAQSNRSNQNLSRLIDQTVKSNQLIMKRFQPSSSGDVQVRFENTVFNNLVAWLYQLENSNGVVIKDLSINPGSDSGLVNASIRLRQGA